MKTAGRLDGERSKRWMVPALVLGAALAVFPATLAPAAGEKAPRTAGKDKPCAPCVDSLAFSDNGPNKPITVSDEKKHVDRNGANGDSNIFCFENHAGCDVTISFAGHSPFYQKEITVKKGEVRGLEFNKEPQPDPTGTTTYLYTWRPTSCDRKEKVPTAGAQMIVKP